MGRPVVARHSSPAYRAVSGAPAASRRFPGAPAASRSRCRGGARKGRKPVPIGAIGAGFRRGTGFRWGRADGSGLGAQAAGFPSRTGSVLALLENIDGTGTSSAGSAARESSG